MEDLLVQFDQTGARLAQAPIIFGQAAGHRARSEDCSVIRAANAQA